MTNTNITYANLVTKSHYSTGLGVGTTTEIIKKAMEKKLHGLALTDRSTVSGLLDFYNKGKELKFPIILGTEIFYFNSLNKLKKIVLLAKNQEGYTNLCKLITASYENEDRYNEPCVSIYDLNENHSELICIASEVEIIKDLKQIFRDRFYLNIALTNLEEQKIINQHIILSNENYIVSSDAYLPDTEYKELQDVMILSAKNSDKIIFQTAQPILSASELLQQWKMHHQYLSIEQLAKGFKNSIIISDECSKIELKFKDQIVNFPHLLHPLNHDGCSKEELVWRIAKEYGRLPLGRKEYCDRFQYEMDSITKNKRINLVDYFLVLEDLCRWCRENGIMVGPGRGSGAGSLINYCLKVTHLDPIKFSLLFERFISTGRIEKGTLPDVDLDFSDPERVRQYLIEKYGNDRVFRIGTFQTLQTAGSIKDIMKSTHPEVDFMTVNRVTSSMGKKDLEETEVEFFERNIDENKVVQEFFLKYPEVQHKVEKLIGYNRQKGQHPCGLAITQDPVINFAPLRKFKGKWVLEFNAPACEQAGIIKYDILSLNTLNYIQTTCDLVGIKDPYEIPLDDIETHRAFQSGDTNAVFQFNSDVAINILTKLPLEAMSLDVESMVTSVGRPGPMGNGQHIEFYRRVRGERFSIAPHYALEEELKPTYGIMIYQENVMKASQILGGFSLAEADDIRKAMGKKKASILVPYKERFIKYCQEKYPETKDQYKDEDGNLHNVSRAEHIWNLMATFSGYGFCKAHSMSYTLVGYICQYLKTHHPLEWWTSCLMHAGDDKLSKYYEDAKIFCIDPDINKSENTYKIVDNKIQMPISAIKGLGPKATEEIYNLRPFTSFEDFFTRINKTRINKAVVLRLIYAGCFDQLCSNMTKQEMINYYFEQIRKEKIPEELVKISKATLINERIKALIYLDKDLYQLFSEYSMETPTKYENIVLSTKPILILGKVSSLKKRKTKKDTEYGDLTVENMGEEVRIRVWSENLEIYTNMLVEKAELKLYCTTSMYNEKIQLTLVNCQRLEMM